VTSHRVRPFETSDGGACLEIFDSNVPGAFGPDERADFEAFLTALPGPFLVVEVPSQGIVACGGVAAEPDAPRVGSLCWGMVRNDRPGRGLGRVPVEARIRVLEAGGDIEVLRLETVPETICFFRHMGFEVIAEDPEGYGPGLPRVELRRPITHEDTP